MIILIDNGHGIETPGKRSPDGTLKEWRYTRDIAMAVALRLNSLGVDTRLLVSEDRDISLAERCRRVNAICQQRKAIDVALVSIHCNASGSDGLWHEARGWSVFTALNGSVESCRLAESLYDAAVSQGLKTRTPLPRQHYWRQNLAICRNTLCPAVLTENLFQDNRADVAYLLSAEGRKAITDLHVDGILRYIKSFHP